MPNDGNLRRFSEPVHKGIGRYVCKLHEELVRFYEIERRGRGMESLIEERRMGIKMLHPVYRLILVPR